MISPFEWNKHIITRHSPRGEGTESRFQRIDDKKIPMNEMAERATLKLIQIIVILSNMYVLERLRCR